MFEKETIAAISTGITNSGIGIVRMSGKDAINILEKYLCRIKILK